MPEQEIVIFLVVITLLLLVVVIITLFIVFSRKKNSLLEEKKRELSKAQIEIREETLRNISWELHDNIGQLMTLAKIHAQMAQSDSSKIESVIYSVDKGLKELRSLSRIINPTFIKNMGLVEAIKLDMERYNRLDFIKSNLTIKGPIQSFDKKQETILFRIIQEFFTNSIRHSRATQLNVSMIFTIQELKIHIYDNGIGFPLESTDEGIGIQSMKNRAELIGAKINLSSTINEGTSLRLIYYF